MARTRPSAEEARQALLVAAEQFVNVHRGAAVVIVRGEVDVIRRTLGARPAKPDPGELRGYELRIIQALTHTPVGHRCLARAAGLTPNNYFRGQLSLLVEAGRIRRTRRGYSRS